MITRDRTRSVFARGSQVLVTLALAGWFAPGAESAEDRNDAAAASSVTADSRPEGACDGRRFEVGESCWKGRPGEASWWWRIRFSEPRDVGAILQVQGDDPAVLRNAPRQYVWQTSLDGETWQSLEETATPDESRIFRLHRLKKPRRASYLRLLVTATTGEAPTLREVEVFDDPAAAVAFDPWVVVVNTTDDKAHPHEGFQFLPLAQSCPDWKHLQGQFITLAEFNETFSTAEPRPLCAFLSGNMKDWCQQDREGWRGTQEVLNARNLPIWASCGGAQGLAILSETGVDNPWDCPHCRDPQAPKTPIYTHIQHLREGKLPCGDYKACVFERGPHEVAALTDDPAFAGLPASFTVMESHCGQIEWAPKGWTLIATAGNGTTTPTQCLKVKDRPIYAAQFHIEMAGTPEISRRIMDNFLNLARDWEVPNPATAPADVPAPRD